MNCDFEIRNKGPVSHAFLNEEIVSFQDAAKFIKALPYARNTDKNDVLGVLRERCGTCSTKHALLKRLADENNKNEVQLMQGIFKMNGRNTPAIRDILLHSGLDHIPEAHNYLNIKGHILDCTSPDSDAGDFINALYEEIEVEAQQVTEFKINYHKQFLKKWREEHGIIYNEEEIWYIREACIKALNTVNS